MRYVLLLFSLLAASAALAGPRTALESADKPDRSAASHKEFQALEGEARTRAIGRIEAYLGGIHSVVAQFSQISADGSTANGKFFLKRPGKMRWQYDPPTPLLLVSDGKSITYYDAELDQTSYIGMDDTLASFLTRKTITLDSDSTQLTRVEGAEGKLRVTLIQRKKPDEGSLTLEFSEKPFEIAQLTTIDATGSETRVSLANAQFGPVLDDKLFTFVNPHGINDRRNRRR